MPVAQIAQENHDLLWITLIGAVQAIALAWFAWQQQRTKATIQQTADEKRKRDEVAANKVEQVRADNLKAVSNAAKKVDEMKEALATNTDETIKAKEAASSGAESVVQVVAQVKAISEIVNGQRDLMERQLSDANAKIIRLEMIVAQLTAKIPAPEKLGS